MSARLTLVLLGALTLAACDEKKTEATTATPSASVVASAAPSATPSAVASASAVPTTTAPPADPNAIPTQADEAKKAATEIDKANYKSELDKLDKEIGK